MSPKIKRQDLQSRMAFADDALEAERFQDMMEQDVTSLDDIRDDLNIGIAGDGPDADEEFYGEN